MFGYLPLWYFAQEPCHIQIPLGQQTWYRSKQVILSALKILDHVAGVRSVRYLNAAERVEFSHSLLEKENVSWTVVRREVQLSGIGTDEPTWGILLILMKWSNSTSISTPTPPATSLRQTLSWLDSSHEVVRSWRFSYIEQRQNGTNFESQAQSINLA